MVGSGGSAGFRVLLLTMLLLWRRATWQARAGERERKLRDELAAAEARLLPWGAAPVTPATCAADETSVDGVRISAICLVHLGDLFC